MCLHDITVALHNWLLETTWIYRSYIVIPTHMDEEHLKVEVLLLLEFRDPVLFYIHAWLDESLWLGQIIQVGLYEGFVYWSIHLLMLAWIFVSVVVVAVCLICSVSDVKMLQTCNGSQ